ncbi:MAG: phosphoribosylanthranilate isomerase [Candidatus Omnitrophota bacterium]|nr:phosphoribosylanthranilate isomerase [Candidatus Omnitrophota bacterium]
MTKIKICGITNKVDALSASDLGVDMLGFVFYKKSKRYVTPALAEDIINELPPFIGRVGVFVDEKREDVFRIAEDAGLDILQFHGNETPEYCGSFRPDYKVIKAFRVQKRSDLKNVNDYDTDYYLFDTYDSGRAGGTGKKFDWAILKDFEILKPMILSGGLKPDNVENVIKELAPFAVDVSSGVESAPGKKDIALLKKFVANARKGLSNVT